MTQRGRCRWALLLAWLPAGEWGPRWGGGGGGGVPVPSGAPFRPGTPLWHGEPGPGRRRRDLPGVNVVRGGGGERRRPRGEGKGWPGPGERCFPPLVSFPGGRKSGAFPRWVRKPRGEEFRYPKGAASRSPRRKWPPASWQPPVSLVCGRLGLGRSTGCKHGGVPLWLVRSAHPSLCC